VEKLNYSFEFDSIETLDNTACLQSGFFIWVWHVTKIPPHIGCSIDGSYYALKVQSKDLAIPVDSVISVVAKKNIPTFLIKLNTTAAINSAHIDQVFREESLLSSGLNSCTTPINKLFNCPANYQLAELLEVINETIGISKTIGFHVPHEQKGILNYTKREIEDRIKLLTDAKRKTRLPENGGA